LFNERKQKKMKNRYSAILLSAAILLPAGCSDEEYNSKYTDPFKASTVSVDKLMTGVFLAGRDFTFPAYYRYFAYDSQWLGRFSQTFGNVKEPDWYLGGYTSYIEDGWGKFYNILTQYRLLEYTYNQLEEVSKASYEAYYLAATVYMYDMLFQHLVKYGKCPYNEACRLPFTNDVPGSYAKWDDEESLFNMMLDDLKTINNRLADNSLTVPKTFSAQDYINDGSFVKWRIYANSLRLRTALLVSGNGPLTNDARNAIAEILSDPGRYPVVENNDEMIRVKNQGTGEINFDGMDGLGDWTFCRLASQAMIDRMQDDPRLVILYDTVINPFPDRTSRYAGTDMNETYPDQENNVTNNRYSLIRRGAPFWESKTFDAVIVTAAEISFIKAEACQKGWVPGKSAADAREAFLKGVIQSVSLYYDYEEASKGSPKERFARPGDTEIAAFAEKKWNDFADKEDGIMTQKWVHFGIIQSLLAWNDIRRTGYPSGLIFPTDPGSTCPDVPNRWIYPNDERNYNSRNYSAVQAYDKYETKLFWAR
jgi:hypothetical protein